VIYLGDKGHFGFYPTAKRGQHWSLRRAIADGFFDGEGTSDEIKEWLRFRDAIGGNLEAEGWSDQQLAQVRAARTVRRIRSGELRLHIVGATVVAVSGDVRTIVAVSDNLSGSLGVLARSTSMWPTMGGDHVVDLSPRRRVVLDHDLDFLRDERVPQPLREHWKLSIARWASRAMYNGAQNTAVVVSTAVRREAT
jgi:hypothetical protein